LKVLINLCMKNYKPNMTFKTYEMFDKQQGQYDVIMKKILKVQGLPYGG
jgi:hypothetical protein